MLLFDDRPSYLRRKAAVLCGLLLLANGAAWAWAFALFGDRPALIGTALLAYVFGLRHAFDTDHIAAIDNAVRRMMAEGRRPLSAGFFFSLGHSTIVVLACAAVASATLALKDQLETIHAIGGMIGTAISAAFLIAMGLVNLAILFGLWTAWTRLRRGLAVTDRDLDPLLSGRGFLARVFGPVVRLVSRSWHLYPVGFLFGLGFDTATEIGVLGLSAGQAAQGLPAWSILVFPALFTAGMSLMDTLDSILMTGAYGWAVVHPVRKLWYNLTITAASVAVALFVGGFEALGLLADRLGLEGPVWRWIGDLNDDLGSFGIAIVGLFAASWIASAAIYKFKGYDRLRSA